MIKTISNKQIDKGLERVVKKFGLEDDVKQGPAEIYFIDKKGTDDAKKYLSISFNIPTVYITQECKQEEVPGKELDRIIEYLAHEIDGASNGWLDIYVIKEDVKEKDSNPEKKKVIPRLGILE